MVDINLGGLALDEYLLGLKAELAREGSDKAAVKAEIARVSGGQKETATAPKKETA